MAAVDAETADKALKLIAVEYEVLPFVLDPEEAMKPTAPKHFPDGNIEGEARIFIRGDVAHLDEGLTTLLARKAGLPVKLQFTPSSS